MKNIKINEKLHQRLKKLAVNNGVTLTELIEGMLKEGLKPKK